MFVHPLYIHTPPVPLPQGCTHPICPPYSSVHLYVLGGFACHGQLYGAPFCVRTLPLHHPCMGVPPLHWHPTLNWLPCALVCFRDTSMLCGIFPSVEGFRGVSPSVGDFGGHQHLNAHMLILVHIFVVHYVSCFYYSSDYYSTGYSGIFWPVIIVISDSGSFPDRVLSELGSAWSGYTTTLDAKRLWRCYWGSFYATAATSIFDASSSLWQLCYGFFTGRFLFQS